MSDLLLNGNVTLIIQIPFGDQIQDALGLLENIRSDHDSIESIVGDDKLCVLYCLTLLVIRGSLLLANVVQSPTIKPLKGFVYNSRELIGRNQERVNIITWIGENLSLYRNVEIALER